MEALISVIIFDIVVLIFAIKNKRFLYTRNPEKHFKDAINAFDKNKKAIVDLNMSDYKLGSGHIYQ